MIQAFEHHLSSQLEAIRSAGFQKHERLLLTPQGGRVEVDNGRPLVNLCANNYLGLADDPRLIEAAKQALDRDGFGMASVRFICGTQPGHRELERKIAGFLGMEDSILYSSCFDANGGLFETLLGPEDTVISDALNHASIIDGIRLCRSQRLRYANNDMADLDARLEEAAGARFRLIATDGVFSMDGVVANLAAICELAKRHDALVMVDDSHAVGVLGAAGRGSIEHCGVLGHVDIVTGTLGKALGGASGGYTAGSARIVALLRQRSRPYLFSNALMPAIVGASLAALDLQAGLGRSRARLAENAAFFRHAMEEEGFVLAGGEHPIIPVMIGEAALAQSMARDLFEAGILATAFAYPVVPKGAARIRTQMSATHAIADLQAAVEAFARTGRAHGVIA